MDLKIDLKNIKIENIKEKILKTDKKTFIKIGIAVGSIVLFLIIYYAILNPIVDRKKAKLEKMIKTQDETAKFISEIKSKKKKIKKLTPQYKKYSTLFHSRAEVEGLYQTLSEFADENNLIISKIEKKEIKEVSKSEALAQGDKKRRRKRRKNLKRLKKLRM